MHSTLFYSSYFEFSSNERISNKLWSHETSKFRNCVLSKIKKTPSLIYFSKIKNLTQFSFNKVRSIKLKLCHHLTPLLDVFSAFLEFHSSGITHEHRAMHKLVLVFTARLKTIDGKEDLAHIRYTGKWFRAMV